MIFWFPEKLTYYFCIFLNKLNKSQIADAHLIMCYFWKLSRPSLVFVWEKNPKNFSFSSSYTSSQIIQLHILFFLCLTEQLKQNSNQKSKLKNCWPNFRNNFNQSQVCRPERQGCFLIG